MQHIHAGNVTVADFQRAAERHARAFWYCTALAGAAGYYWHWWAIAPGVPAVWYAVKTLAAGYAALQLEKGTYRARNPNNVAPAGLADPVQPPTVTVETRTRQITDLEKSLAVYDASTAEMLGELNAMAAEHGLPPPTLKPPSGG
jgi:hypothetical protein